MKPIAKRKRHEFGVAVAIVTQNTDPLGNARVRVSFPWHAEPTQSYWARIAVPMAGKNAGTYFLPEVGDEVLVAFERGNINLPYVIGALWDHSNAPPESNSDGNNDKRLIRSRKGHQLQFDDNATHGSVVLALNDGKKIHIDDAGIRLEDVDGSRLTIESRSGALTIEATQKLTLRAPQVVLESAGTLDLRAGSTVTIRGALVAIN